jgi:hypothetical protein
MPSLKEDEALKKKLDEIRKRLTGEPSAEELESMQLHIALLERWARLVSSADADHQHNHMTDHDNTAFFEPTILVQQSKEQV